MAEHVEKKHKADTTDRKEKYLVFGSTGWIGGHLIEYLEGKGEEVHKAKSRLQDLAGIAVELDTIKPTIVLNCAGLTGRPNVDWCEDHKEEVLRVNVIGTMGLADACNQRGIHMTNFGTGCIYSYDKDHPMGSGKGFTEKDPPNFTGSFYSYTKGMVQQMLETYTNVLTLRLRMPISDDLFHRNFITKISKYERVVNIPNSMTVLFEYLPLSIRMSKARLHGTYNFTNPGVISHNQVLDLYKKYINPNFTYKNFTLEDQAKILKAERSNNELDTTKLENCLPGLKVDPIYQAVEKVFQRMKKNLDAKKLMKIADN